MTIFRVPLILNVSYAVLHRHNYAATKELEAHSGSTSGYDDVFQEPIIYDDLIDGEYIRRSGRIECPAIRIPCQVENSKHGTEDMKASGHNLGFIVYIVFHVKDLTRLKLIEDTGELLIKVGDRLAAVENKAGKAVMALPAKGLFAHEVKAGSHGFGSRGHDLYIVEFREREREAGA